MKKSRFFPRIGMGLLCGILLLTGCGSATESTVDETEETSEEVVAVPDFIVEMYMRMEDLTEEYDLCYQMGEAPYQDDTTLRGSYYWTFDVMTEELDDRTSNPGQESHDIQFINDQGEQNHSYEILLHGPTGTRYTERKLAQWIDIVAAAAASGDPNADFDEVKARVTEMITAQDPEEISTTLEIGDYQITMGKHAARTTRVYAVYGDETWVATGLENE